MNVMVTSVNVKYDNEGNQNGVQVQFKASNKERTINANGFIPLTNEQYEGNESIDKLTGIVRQEFANQIMEEPNT
ncbi:hypothetical protein J416_09544 [Gracilibacillus halophilus YIM-C55.5]|uniref:Uncharacterized protein n=1 Tax=Gracilibacillus halophilus YIM-C55.5 TaxID=1308866 RepID=N4WUD7_9BACI|nr:hypothetical protein [Gracilibacillus halophilus]ENH96731.1 hypothetical protein J416_09544 [Gracilibacillus halophilus YIM-C55.5]